MKSIGYGAYDGTLGAPDILGGVNAFFEPVEVLEPSELKGAMLSRGFKIEKIQVGGNPQYKIMPNFGPLATLASVALPAELARFAGVSFDPAQAFETKIIGHTLSYTPPKSNLKLMAIAAGIGLLVVLGIMKL